MVARDVRKASATSVIAWMLQPTMLAIIVLRQVYLLGSAAIRSSTSIFAGRRSCSCRLLGQ